MYTTLQERLSSAIAALAMLALIAAAVVVGLSVAPQSPRLGEPLAVFDVTPPPPPPKPPKPPVTRSLPTSRQHAANNAPSPRNLRNQATQVVAPMMPPLIVPPPIIAAPQAGTGSASNTGASDRAGPGQGAGGAGDGTGGGGDGAGDGEGNYSAPRQVRGDLRMSDLPRGLIDEGRGAQLEVRYRVYANGRVGECRVIASSGNTELDALSCQSIERRFRYRPSRDGSGRAVASSVIQRFSWSIDRDRIERGNE